MTYRQTNSLDGSLVDEPKGSSDPILNRDEAIEIPPRSASSGHNRPFDPLQNVELTHYHFDGYGRQRPGSSLPPSPRSPGCLYTFQNPNSDVGERWLVLVTSGETESLGNIEVFKEEVKREAKNETFKVVLQRMTVSGSTPLGGMPAMPAKPTRKYFIDEWPKDEKEWQPRQGPCRRLEVCIYTDDERWARTQCACADPASGSFFHSGDEDPVERADLTGDVPGEGPFTVADDGGSGTGSRTRIELNRTLDIVCVGYLSSAK